MVRLKKSFSHFCLVKNGSEFPKNTQTEKCRVLRRHLQSELVSFSFNDVILLKKSIIAVKPRISRYKCLSFTNFV